MILETINAYVRTKLGRFVTPRRYDQIFNEVERLHAKNIMEIGTYRGVRGVEMIERAKKYTPAEQIHYFGFDLFETMDTSQYAHEISKQPLSQEDIHERLSKTGAQVSLFKGNTLESMPRKVPSLPKMDIIFIDGGHSYETIKNDWEWSEKLMHETTAVIFDDYWMNREDGAKPIVDAIDKSKFTVEVMPVLDVFYNPDWGKLAIKLAKVTRK